MRRKIILPSASLIIVFQVCDLATARIAPVLDLPQLTSKANLIVVGEVTSISEENRGFYEISGTRTWARRMSATLGVERTLKGEPKAEVIFKYLSPDNEFSYAEITNDQFGIFFLRSNSEELSPASPYYPFILASRDKCSTEGDDLARVVAELGCVIQSSNASLRERHDAIQALASARTPESTAVLQKAASEQVSPFNYIAASLLLERNDISALPIVEETWKRSAAYAVNDEGMSLTGHLGHTLEGIKNPSAIPSLTRLLGSEDVHVRRGVVQALRNIKTKTAIEPLATALDDSDWEVRHVAVMGLAAIAGPDKDGNSWYPAYDTFKQNEQLYLDHWREWSEQRKRNP
ncbi:MAG: HEAT repeat domain-containing protein [Acidobacteria bacterium]|nr:HEAT repeat domain-containing protein [Acidobacteriota bacterium]